MSSETSSLERGGSGLTQYHLVDPKTAYGNIISSITRREKVTLAAIVSAGIGEISVRAAITQVEVEVLFNGLDRVEADRLFGSDGSPQLEARGVTKHPNSLDSDDDDKRPLIVVFQQSGGNEVDFGHFFLETE
mgnify:CR=1 FL=1